MILIDTSVWIEFFKSQSATINPHIIELLLEEEKLATCFPVITEVLSGDMSNKNRAIAWEGFTSMTSFNLDLNSKHTWEELIELAHLTKKYKLALPGLIDRIILLTAKKYHLDLWSLDKKLIHLAQNLEISIFQKEKLN